MYSRAYGRKFGNRGGLSKIIVLGQKVKHVVVNTVLQGFIPAREHPDQYLQSSHNVASFWETAIESVRQDLAVLTAP